MFVVYEAGENTLQNYLSTKGKMAEEEALPIFEQIMAALSYLHSKNIAHKSLNCLNVILKQTKPVIKVKVTNPSMME